MVDPCRLWSRAAAHRARGGTRRRVQQRADCSGPHANEPRRAWPAQSYYVQEFWRHASRAPPRPSTRRPSIAQPAKLWRAAARRSVHPGWLVCPMLLHEKTKRRLFCGDQQLCSKGSLDVTSRIRYPQPLHLDLPCKSGGS